MKQANDIGHNHPPIPIDGNDLKVAKTAASQLPANFEFDAAEKAQNSILPSIARRAGFQTRSAGKRRRRCSRFMRQQLPS
jgi:hypothetical protein